MLTADWLVDCCTRQPSNQPHNQEKVTAIPSWRASDSSCSSRLTDRKNLGRSLPPPFLCACSNGVSESGVFSPVMSQQCTWVPMICLSLPRFLALATVEIFGRLGAKQVSKREFALRPSTYNRVSLSLSFCLSVCLSLSFSSKIVRRASIKIEGVSPEPSSSSNQESCLPATRQKQVNSICSSQWIVFRH